MNKREELQGKLEELKVLKIQTQAEIIGKINDIITELSNLPPDEPKEYKRYYPEPGQAYWHLDSRGAFMPSIWKGGSVDLLRLYTTPLFRTEAEVMRYKEIHTTIMDIASKYPVDGGVSWYEVAVMKNGKCLCWTVNISRPTAHAIRTSKDISEEINNALSTDDLLFYRAVT